LSSAIRRAMPLLARSRLVVVAGKFRSPRSAGDDAGHARRIGPHWGGTRRASKRETIIAVGGIEVPITYWHACTFQPPHVRLTLTYLRRRYRLAIEDKSRAAPTVGTAASGRPRPGEILEWAAQ